MSTKDHVSFLVLAMASVVAGGCDLGVLPCAADPASMNPSEVDMAMTDSQVDLEQPDMAALPACTRASSSCAALDGVDVGAGVVLHCTDFTNKMQPMGWDQDRCWELALDHIKENTKAPGGRCRLSMPSIKLDCAELTNKKYVKLYVKYALYIHDNERQKFAAHIISENEKILSLSGISSFSRDDRSRLSIKQPRSMFGNNLSYGFEFELLGNERTDWRWQIYSVAVIATD